jgi:hypothetical protein
VPETEDINYKDIAYIAITIGICVAIKFSGMTLTTILMLNGTLIGFLITYALPIGLHIKCVFFSKSNAETELVNLPPIGVYSNRY